MGDGEKATVELVVRRACGCVFGGAAAAGGFAAAAGPGAGATVGAGVTGAEGAVVLPVLLAGSELDRIRGIVSEPVLRPRIFASWMFGIRRMCGVSMMMISVWSRDFCS